MYNLLIFIYFIYIQVLPITHDNIQLVLMAAIVAIAFLKFSQSMSSVTTQFLSKNKNLLAFKIIIINSFIFTLFGLLTNQPGAKEYLILETIFPLLYLAVFSTAGKSDNFAKIMDWCFTISTFVIGVIFVLQMLNFGGGSDFAANLNDADEVEGIAKGSNGEVTGIRFVPLPSLTYLTSISLHNLAKSINDFFRKNKPHKDFLPEAKSNKIGKIFAGLFLISIHLFNFASTLLCIILSGRQGLLVGFIGSLAVIIIIQAIASFTNIDKSMRYVEEGRKHITLMLSTILFFIIMILLVNNFVEFIHIDYQSLIERFTEKNKGDIDRLGQFSALLDSWYESPIIGHGNGALVSWVRNDERPWRYELGHILRLHNMGLLGTGLQCFGFLLICIDLVRNFYKTGKIFYISSLAGLLSLLIADGTNPYMLRFTVLYYLHYCLWLSMNKENLDLPLIWGKGVKFLKQ
jgi:O-antigen ligase